MRSITGRLLKVSMSKNRRWALVGLSLLLVLAIVAGSVIWQATHALKQSELSLRTASEVPFGVNRLVSPVAGSQPPFETINSLTGFNDVCLFRDRVYIGGAAGILAYDRSGNEVARYRVGIELPPAPVLALSTGVAADAGEDELFIATDGEGLLAFNGSSFRQFRPDDLSYRHLTALLPLPSGRILIGTAQHGVLVYDRKRITPFHPAFSDLHITALAGSDSNLWVGTLAEGVWHWRAGEIDRFGALLSPGPLAQRQRQRSMAIAKTDANLAEAAPLPDPQILSLAAEGDRAYAGTPLGVAEFRDNRFYRILASGVIARSLYLRNDTLEVGTIDEGILPVVLNSQAHPAGVARASDDFALGEVKRVLELENRLYALGSDGLYSVDGAEAGRATLGGQSTLSDRNISALAVDSTGKLWVGYFDRGLDVLTPDAGGGFSSSHVRHIENDNVFCVNRIVPSSERGLTAVATANGLVMFDVAGNIRQVLKRADGLIANYISDVAMRPEGMTVATSAGLTFIDSGGVRSLYAFQGLVNNHVYALAAARGQLLAGTLGGLSVLAGPGADMVRASYTTSNSRLRQNWITAILPVEDGWWVGTYGAGIMRFDGMGHWEPLADATGGFEVNFNAMLSTPSRVYAGTTGRGLMVYSRSSGRWTAIGVGLPSLNVTALAAAGDTVYVGTDNGLVRFAEPKLVVQ